MKRSDRSTAASAEPLVKAPAVPAGAVEPVAAVVEPVGGKRPVLPNVDEPGAVPGAAAMAAAVATMTPTLVLPPDDLPELPPGDPLGWTVEQLVTVSGMPIEKLLATLRTAAEHSGAAGISLKVIERMWLENTSPEQRALVFRLIGTGLARTVLAGRGPHGHAGVELA